MNLRPPRYLLVTVHVPLGGTSTVHLQGYTFYAEHRDIAFELAMQFGRDTCFGREFCGLAYLGITQERIVRMWREESGDASDYVVSKNQLAAFSNRWFARRCDPDLLSERTTEPPLRMQLDCLNQIPWYAFEHAYGNAFDIPKEIRRLTSTDDQIRSGALECLYGTIYHQGSIFPATVPSIDPLLQIIANTSISDRGSISELFYDISESAWVTPEQTKKKWAQLADLPYSDGDYSDREIQERMDVRNEITSHYSQLCDLALDADEAVAEKFRGVIELFASA